MSPTRKPSTVAGLRAGMTVPASEKRVSEMTTAEIQTLAGAAPKPARVTLNLPPELYRQLNRWCDSMADTIDVPRVGVQEAMRAMIRVITGDEAPTCAARVAAELRVQLHK